MQSSVTSTPESPITGDQAPPPDGNTGGNHTNLRILSGYAIHLDTLRGTFSRQYLDQVLSLLEPILGKPEAHEGGVKGYQGSLWFPVDGTFIATSEKHASCLLVLPGKAMERFRDGRACLDLVHYLDTIGFNCTRADPALDDFEGLIPLDQVNAAGERGNFLGFRSHTPVKKNAGGQVVGETHYFGERGKNGKGIYPRFYNKTQQSGETSGAEHPHVRYEVEVTKTGKHSQQLFAEMAECETVPQLERVLSRALGGAITFVERNGFRNGNTDRMERLTWWVKVLDVLGSAKYRAIRTKTTPERRFIHLQKMCKMIGKAINDLDDATPETGINGMYLVRKMIEAKRPPREPRHQVKSEFGIPHWRIRQAMEESLAGARFAGGQAPQALAM